MKICQAQLHWCVNTKGLKTALVLNMLETRSALQEKKKAAERANFTKELKQVAALPNPSGDRWKYGPFAAQIDHLEEFAKNSDVAAAPHADALYALVDMECHITPDGAAHLLKKIGVWDSKIPNTLVRCCFVLCCGASARTVHSRHGRVCAARLHVCSLRNPETRGSKTGS